MTCDACARASTDPRSGLYRLGCRDCSARMLAQAPVYAIAEAQHRITDAYKAALATVQADGETIESAHKRVREWDRRIRGPREAEPVPAQGQASENAATGREMASPGQS